MIDKIISLFNYPSYSYENCHILTLCHLRTTFYRHVW